MRQRCATKARTASAGLRLRHFRLSPYTEIDRNWGNLGGFLMSQRMITAIAAVAALAGMAMTQASAQDVKVGVILPFTGVGAELAQQIERGAQLYLELNPDQAKPYTFTMIKRDSKAPNGAEAKIATQELLTQDKVDVLAGGGHSPDAIASAPVGNARHNA